MPKRPDVIADGAVLSLQEGRALLAAGGGVVRRSKYGAKAQVIDGIWFASKLEAARFSQLRLLERAGAIKQLRRQLRFPLVVNGQTVGTYVADFEYLEPRGQGGFAAGALVHVVEDAKGMRLPLYKLKAALFCALYPDIEFREVR